MKLEISEIYKIYIFHTGPLGNIIYFNQQLVYIKLVK